LLVRKDGDTGWYCKFLIKEECSEVVKNVITDFGIGRGVCLQALTYHVIGALRESYDLRDEIGDWPHYASDVDDDDEDKSDDEEGDEDEEDEIKDGDGGEDEDGESDSSDE